MLFWPTLPTHKTGTALFVLPTEYRHKWYLEALQPTLCNARLETFTSIFMPSEHYAICIIQICRVCYNAVGHLTV